MGKEPGLLFTGNWLTTYVVAPLVLNGWLPVPRYIISPCARPPAPAAAPDDTETLHAVLEAYLDCVHTGDIEPNRHPILGDIGIDGWDKMHVFLFEHHLARFGA